MDDPNNNGGGFTFDDLFDYPAFMKASNVEVNNSTVDVSYPGVIDGTVNPLDLLLKSPIPSPAAYREHESVQDCAESLPAGLTIEELQQQITFMEHQKETEIYSLQQQAMIMEHHKATEINDLKATHAKEMEALRIKNEALRTKNEALRIRNDELKAKLQHFMIAAVPTPAPTPAATPVTPPARRATPAPMTVAAPMTPEATPTEHGFVETMWLPETSPAQRAAMMKGRKAPPMHPAPFYEGNIGPRPTTSSSPTASNNFGLATPLNTNYNGFTPAPGSSPPVIAASPSASSLIQAQLTNSPSPGPKNRNTKPRVPAKPRASAASKRTTAAATKSAAKATKSVSKRKSASPSASTRSLHELYAAQFSTLTHEEKCQLVLPLLQGVDPHTGLTTGAMPGPLANTTDFEAAGSDTLSSSPVQDQMEFEPQYQSPYADYAPEQLQMGHEEAGESQLSILLHNYLYGPAVQQDTEIAAQACGTLQGTAQDMDDRMMMQQAACEYEANASAGAMRQQEALQRTQPRRR